MSSGAEFARRLAAYIRARDVYLKGLVETSEGRATAGLDMFVESARLSEDFTPGYAQCLTIASLEATLSAYDDGTALQTVPTLRLLTEPLASIRRRARRLLPPRGARQATRT